MDWTTAKELNDELLFRLHRGDPKVERLAGLAFFDGCSRRALSGAARLVDFVEAKAGTVLARQGTPAAQVLILVKGAVEVTKPGSDPRTAAKGEVFGEMAALSRLPHPETLVAQGPVEVAVIGVQNFLALLDSQPCLALKVLERAVKQPQRVA
ncbi:MAG TPA: cyclic nucleotide-binding domain-containing protein [Actinomycetota bacterium]|nr:cyclic nucleotide-binding domain-containing protein [Actinomycetota bacterium]